MNLDRNARAAIAEPRAALRTWGVCVLMLLATMLNYMDRLALSQQATKISGDLKLSNEDYAQIESGFGLAFAVGGIVTGLIADRLSPRWLYPVVLSGWSTVGFATGWVTSFHELLVCRVLLGFFEAGQWPCALVTAQRMLSRRDRPLGNSLIQSGASLGAIATPFVVLFLTTDAHGSWRVPFRVIGSIGVVWVVAWLTVVRRSDLILSDSALPELAPENDHPRPGVPANPSPTNSSTGATFWRRFLALAVVVVVINLCWQFFRAWMPKMLGEEYHYSAHQVQYFSIAYYVAADVGCLTIGFLTRYLTGRGFSIHGARVTTFLVCSLLTASSMLAAALPASGLLLATLLVIGFGSLGQFPTYYSFTQELSARRMGNITGVLSFLTWMVHANVQKPIGRWIDRTGSFSQVMFLAGLTPLLGLLAVLVLWNTPRRREPV
ncbi:MAG TPA: MFS transporter [Isosphaeraceae bacterium]|nr:MFS transporter [Isosphaeraceae bacterium]